MNLTTSEIFNTLKIGKPVSIIRAGDGEKIVLESNKDLAAYQLCIKSVMIRQMGYEPTMGEVEQIRKNLVTAYSGADIVGIPDHSNLESLGKHWRDTEAVIQQYTTTKKFTSTDVGYEMLYNGMLKEWLKGKTVTYISCRNIDAGLMQSYGVKHVNSYIIAPEAKFTSTHQTGDKHFPEQFNKVEWWLDRAEVQGHACLVGAGVIGKIYCNWMRDRGGVAIDLGAVFDLWAGFSTRGPQRGLDVKDETYKL